MKKAININWETDGYKVDLPKEVKIPKGIKDDEIADYLSDNFDWLVNSFDIIGS